MGRVDGLIIPRSYNDYFSKSDTTDIRLLVAGYTDASLSNTSELPVQNKVVKDALDNITDVIPSGATSSNKLATAQDVNTNASAISAIEEKIPTQASAQNQLADKDFVNSSIGTNTANYINDNGEPFTSIAALEAYSGTVTNNDYAFVTGTDSAGNTYYDRYKATVSGSTVTWAKEYRLNNSAFTAAQWAALNSGITAQIVASIVNQFDTMHPIGEVYTQYPGQKTPNQLWGNFSTWEELDYGGAFFRAAGGNALPFNSSLDISSQSGTTIVFAAAHNLSVGSLLYDAENNECRTVASVTDSTTVEIDAAFTYSNLTNVLIGQYPGLPNITGYFGGYTQGGNKLPDGAGAFNQYLNDQTKIEGSGGTASRGYWNGVTFDASRSNNIYGASNEVQPANFTIKLWKRVS